MAINHSNKPIVNLTEWELHYYKERFWLSGTADYHPKMGKHAYVYQSTDITDHILEDDVLVCETRNTVYVCPLKYMSEHPYRNTLPEHIKKIATLSDSSDGILHRIVAISAQMALTDPDLCAETDKKSTTREKKNAGKNAVQKVMIHSWITYSSFR